MREKYIQRLLELQHELSKRADGMNKDWNKEAYFWELFYQTMGFIDALKNKGILDN